MKKIIFAIAAACAFVAAPAMAEDAAAPAAAEASADHHLSTADTPLGDLLDNAAARAVLEARIPEVIGNPQIEMARPMTLKSLQSYSPSLTDEVLAAIDADLANIH
jgi:hypothetical protein